MYSMYVHAYVRMYVRICLCMYRMPMAMLQQPLHNMHAEERVVCVCPVATILATVKVSVTPS